PHAARYDDRSSRSNDPLAQASPPRDRLLRPPPQRNHAHRAPVERRGRAAKTERSYLAARGRRRCDQTPQRAANQRRAPLADASQTSDKTKVNDKDTKSDKKSDQPSTSNADKSKDTKSDQATAPCPPSSGGAAPASKGGGPRDTSAKTTKGSDTTTISDKGEK